MWNELVNQMFANPDFHTLVIVAYHFLMEIPDATLDYLDCKLFPNY